MENFHRLIKLLAFSLLTAFVPPVSAFIRPDKYFLNCGSSSNFTTNDRRSFVGDNQDPDSSGFKVLASKTGLVEDTTNGYKDPLYRTARVFSSISCYRFNIPETGTYIVRLHFYAFSASASSSPLTSAKFNVSASGHLLISNFNATAAANNPVIEEFVLTINEGELKIFFYPAQEQSSPNNVAFVNAIEVFLTKLDLQHCFNNTLITSRGKGLAFGSLNDNVLRPIHRINFGGQEVVPSEDFFWRKWSVDNAFLLTHGSAINKTWNGDISHSQNDAPNEIYRTARVTLNTTSSEAADFPKSTWSFNVSRNSIHFVRVHFCDVVNKNFGAFTFNFYIYSNFVKKIDPYDAGDMLVPFYYGFVVESDNSGAINISIAPRNDSRLDDIHDAFLNGLEIMEVINASATEPSIDDATSSKKKTALIAGSIGGGVGLVIVVAAAVVWCGVCLRLKKGRKEIEAFDWPLDALSSGGGGGEGGSLDGKVTNKSGSSGSPFNLHLKLRIPFSEIQNVTNDFDELLIIGQGGFGTVYKGTLRNGMKVAVKRSDSNSRHGQGYAEFQAEITVLCKIRHRHLVSLIGYCDENGEMILVYEFMEKGTLKDHLYGIKFSSSANEKDGRKGLTWKQRLEMCIGAAKGLHYLHTGTSSSGRIIHRDVKSTNILLDQHYEAKVADFGLSRLGSLDQQNPVSTDVKGTPGYLDPEYYHFLLLTEKSDVYSFGIVLLEVLCARPVIDRSVPIEQVNLADWAMHCKEKGEIEKIVDPLLVGKINPKSLKKFVETVEKCLRELGADRPPMSDVLWELEYALHLEGMGGGGGQGGFFGDSTSTMDGNSLNMPMLAIPALDSSSFPSPPREEEEEEEGVGRVSMAKALLG